MQVREQLGCGLGIQREPLGGQRGKLLPRPQAVPVGL
jgi:hypothetical protein